ncbi:hypothetical protein J2X08_003783 [Rhizobium rosettiformans]|nr:hypothetical protein [Rhizobium rosettiformans]MDR7066265.1 hypothetical protein [Rhizobium rosettiformans]
MRGCAVANDCPNLDAIAAALVSDCGDTGVRSFTIPAPVVSNDEYSLTSTPSWVFHPPEARNGARGRCKRRSNCSPAYKRPSRVLSSLFSPSKMVGVRELCFATKYSPNSSISSERISPSQSRQCFGNWKVSRVNARKPPCNSITASFSDASQSRPRIAYFSFVASYVTGLEVAMCTSQPRAVPKLG